MTPDKFEDVWKDNVTLAEEVIKLRRTLSGCVKEIELLRSINGILADKMAQFIVGGLTDTEMVTQAKGIMSVAKRLIEKADEDEAALMGKADGEVIA